MKPKKKRNFVKFSNSATSDLIITVLLVGGGAIIFTLLIRWVLL